MFDPQLQILFAFAGLISVEYHHSSRVDEYTLTDTGREKIIAGVGVVLIEAGMLELSKVVAKLQKKHLSVASPRH